MVTSIAATSIGMKSSQTLTAVNVALMEKVLDTAEIQGQAMIDMMQKAAPPAGKGLLDVYA